MKITIKGKCPACSKEWQVEVEEKDWVDYTENGKLAQYAFFSYLTTEERQLLISGICNECWETIFPEEEEDDIIYDIDEEIDNYENS